jgi:syncollin
LEEVMRSALGLAMAALLLQVPANAQTGCILYQHSDYGGAHWSMAQNSFVQMGGEGVSHNNLTSYYRPDWNDQVSSFKVMPGCQLTLWEHASTWGYGARFRSTRSYKYVGSRWNDKASWALCRCPPIFDGPDH